MLNQGIACGRAGDEAGDEERTDDVGDKGTEDSGDKGFRNIHSIFTPFVALTALPMLVYGKKNNTQNDDYCCPGNDC